MKSLNGMQVLNLAVNLPGPIAALRLQQLGASVIKVEPPAGDPLSHYNPTWYKNLTVGQKVITMDLKSPNGRARLDEILEHTDVLITATRPVALERLGLGWTNLNQNFPRLCQVAIVGYPAPRENEAGHDLTYQAEMGLLNPPNLPRTLIADLVGAEMTVSTALALLLSRERGEEGGYEQVALSDAALAMAEPLRYGIIRSGALLGGSVPEYNLYQTSDGWIAVTALEPCFKQRLEAELGGGAMQIEQLRFFFKAKTAAEWRAWGQERDIPIVAVNAVPA